MNWIVLSFICMVMLAAAEILGKKAVEADPVTDALKSCVWFALEGVAAVGLIYLFGLSESGDAPWKIAMRIPEAAWSTVFVIIGGIVGLWAFKSLNISERCSIGNCDTLFLVLITFVVFKITGNAKYIANILTPPCMIGIVLITVSSVLLPVFRKGGNTMSSECNARRKILKYFLLDMALCFLAAICDAMDDFISGYALNEVTADSMDYLIAYGFWILVMTVPVYVILSLKIKKAYNPFRKREIWIFIFTLTDMVLSIIYLFALDAEPLRAPILITAYPVLTFLFSRILRREKLTFRQYACLNVMTVGAVLFAIQ